MRVSRLSALIPFALLAFGCNNSSKSEPSSLDGLSYADALKQSSDLASIIINFKPSLNESTKKWWSLIKTPSESEAGLRQYETFKVTLQNIDSSLTPDQKDALWFMCVDKHSRDFTDQVFSNLLQFVSTHSSADDSTRYSEYIFKPSIDSFILFQQKQRSVAINFASSNPKDPIAQLMGEFYRQKLVSPPIQMILPDLETVTIKVEAESGSSIEQRIKWHGQSFKKFLDAMGYTPSQVMHDNEWSLVKQLTMRIDSFEDFCWINPFIPCLRNPIEKDINHDGLIDSNDQVDAPKSKIPKDISTAFIDALVSNNAFYEFIVDGRQYSETKYDWEKTFDFVTHLSEKEKIGFLKIISSESDFKKIISLVRVNSELDGIPLTQDALEAVMLYESVAEDKNLLNMIHKNCPTLLRQIERCVFWPKNSEIVVSGKHSQSFLRDFADTFRSMIGGVSFSWSSNFGVESVSLSDLIDKTRTNSHNDALLNEVHGEGLVISKQTPLQVVFVVGRSGSGEGYEHLEAIEPIKSLLETSENITCTTIFNPSVESLREFFLSGSDTSKDKAPPSDILLVFVSDDEVERLNNNATSFDTVSDETVMFSDTGILKTGKHSRLHEAVIKPMVHELSGTYAHVGVVFSSPHSSSFLR